MGTQLEEKEKNKKAEAKAKSKRTVKKGDKAGNPVTKEMIEGLQNVVRVLAYDWWKVGKPDWFIDEKQREEAKKLAEEAARDIYDDSEASEIESTCMCEECAACRKEAEAKQDKHCDDTDSEPASEFDDPDLEETAAKKRRTEEKLQESEKVTADCEASVKEIIEALKKLEQQAEKLK